MKEDLTPTKMGLAAFFNFVGGMSGLVSLATIVFFSGSITEKVRSLDGRVTTLETGGSSTYRAHEKLDDQRDAATSAQLSVLANGLAEIHKLDVKVETIGVKLDDIKEQLRKHEAASIK